MRKLACVAATVGAVVAVAAETPAVAAWVQCYDTYNRPLGEPRDTGNPPGIGNPPRDVVCTAYRRGGWCSGVLEGWVANNCGFAPRYRYRDDGSPFRRRKHDN